jgi:hypothetical protein
MANRKRSVANQSRHENAQRAGGRQTITASQTFRVLSLPGSVAVDTREIGETTYGALLLERYGSKKVPK